MTKPKPCPFCGEEPRIHTFLDDDTRFYFSSIECVSCDCCIDGYGKTEEESEQNTLKAWNRRNNPNWIEDMKEWAFSWMEGADEPEFTFFDRVYSAVCWYERKLNR